MENHLKAQMLDGELTFVLKDIFKEARCYPAK